MKANLTRRTVVLATLLAATSMVISACGTTGKPASRGKTITFATAPAARGSWPYPNGDIANTRDAAGSSISSVNVSRLREAWTFKLAGKAAAGIRGVGSLTAPPVVVDGVVFLQDEDANVYALALATGKLKWEYEVNRPVKSGPGPDGVAVTDGAVYGDASTSVFALSAATGKTIWVDDHLLRSGQGTFEIQPQVTDGRVYLASAYGSGPGGGVLMGSARPRAGCCGRSTRSSAEERACRLSVSVRAAPGRRRSSGATDR